MAGALLPALSQADDAFTIVTTAGAVVSALPVVAKFWRVSCTALAYFRFGVSTVTVSAEITSDGMQIQPGDSVIVNASGMTHIAHIGVGVGQLNAVPLANE